MPATAINPVEYEFLYTLFRRAKVRAEPTAHWSARTAAERLEQAARDHPDDPARWSALGELWLRNGNFIRAAHAFGEAHRLDPADPAILLRRAAALVTLDPAGHARDIAAARALGAASPPTETALRIAAPAPAEAVAPIYADISDMMAYLRVNDTFSGIQRVVANIFRQVRDRTGPNARDVIAVIPDYHAGIMFAADMGLIYELIDMVESGRPSRDHLDRLLSAVRGSLRLVVPVPGDIFLMAGAFWILGSYDYLKDLRGQGIVVTIFIHDLIQIDLPGFVDPAATEVFRRSFVDVAEIASFFTTNSVFVAQEVRRSMAETMQLAKPVHPVPLATEMSLIPRDEWADRALQAEFGDAGYVLCVCTIEIRKNHIYLYRLWQELIARGYERLPKLVLVGKWGWEIDDFRALLVKSRYLDGAIKIMAGVSDATLAGLYRNCLFTIYPSFAEGWGLPIGESLVFGKPCIAAGVTSMPEVGGDLVRYIDPLDVTTGIAEVARLLDDPAVLERWTAEVQARFKPRGWSEFAEHLLGATRALALDNRVPAAFARLLPGEIAVVGQYAVQQTHEAGRGLRTARMARDRGWHHLEDSGAWSISPVATLAFIAEGCAPGDVLRVVVLARGEAGQGPMPCSLRSDIETTAPVTLQTRPSPLACRATVAADGLVEMAVIARGEPIRAGDKSVYVNLSGLGYHRIGDDAAAVALMESLTFDR